MTVVRIDHIGIAVSSIADALKLYRDVLGLKVAAVETVTEQKVKVAMLPIGDSRIELLESTDSESPIARHIEKRGEGIHHLALGVQDIGETLRMLKKKGVPLIDNEPRRGAGGSKMAFLHPKGTKVLLEVVEH
ncbi:MAG: methylmalonyl-CoA epimerase [Chloroflexi bacterium]|nr:methylmalonyl-CoA epimerase [Chloroflexota bacterium]